MTKIVAFSGKKGSGKNTCCNFIFGLEMKSLGLVDDFLIDSEGKLYLRKNSFEEGEYVRFDPLSMKDEIVEYLILNVWEHVKIYSFADFLKSICVDVLGLTEEQVSGTDEQKNSLTALRWNKMPVPPSIARNANKLKEHNEKSGFLTAREVMQWVGTEIFREMKPDVWTDSLMRRIKSDNPELALICDCRFLNEVDAVQKTGGKVIRLTRAPYSSSDSHASETQLDNFNGFDFILDNANVDIPQQNALLYYKLKEWEILEYEVTQ